MLLQLHAITAGSVITYGSLSILHTPLLLPPAPLRLLAPLMVLLCSAAATVTTPRSLVS